MGQQASKSHAPLTFGYINQNTSQHRDEAEDTIEDNLHGYSADFVLANPHLYKLESTCHYCSPTIPNEKNVGIADQVCETCRKNKRLSLVIKDLASDLSYIDATYYPNVPHYTSSGSLIIEELPTDYFSQQQQQQHQDDSEEDGFEGWSRLTIGEVTPSTPKRLASASSSLVVDLSGRSLIKLSSSIGYLNNLTKLDL